MTKLSAPITAKLADDDAERNRRSHDEKIRELQTLPAASLIVIPNVSLPDNTVTAIKHSLGRAPRMIVPSIPRNAAAAGIIRIVDSNETASVIKVRADGFGSTIVVDVMVL